MLIGIPKETKPREHRVAMTPANVRFWTEKGVSFLVEAGAGSGAGHLDADYQEAGARIAANRAEVFGQAEILLQVQSFGANQVTAEPDLELLRPGQVVAGLMDPLGHPEVAALLAERGVTAIAMELIPRISRAQAMDVLSSMATLTGYKGVLLGAVAANRIMPLMMTAAGTLQPMRVFVMGAGVAGLQACATAKRLGAVVEAYDVRPAAREQILSVGAKPVELPLETDQAEDKGGYAKAQSEEFLRRQRELMSEVLARQDLVITTASVPGARAPVLITAEMVRAMKPGSVIVDLAAERGGNCELTRLNETVVEHGVTILGPENLAATIPYHASQMYGKNMEVLLSHILDESLRIALDFEDEIIREIVIAHGGEVRHPRLRAALGLPELAPAGDRQEGGEA